MDNKIILIVLILLNSILLKTQSENTNYHNQIKENDKSVLSQIYFETYENTISINIDTALHYLQQSIAVAQKENSSINEKRGVFELANNLSKNGKNMEALKYVKRCIDILPEEHYYQCRCYKLLGDAYREANDFKNAKLALEKADSIEQIKPDYQFKGELVRSWGKYYQFNDENDEALSFYFKALDIGKEISDSTLCFKVLSNISALYNKDY